MNFQVTVLKILVAYPDGFAVMEDLKRDMAILATSGRDWADRTRRLAARVPDLDIWSQGLVERTSGGWKITSKGRAALEFMEAHPAAPEPSQTSVVEETTAAMEVAKFLLCRSPPIVPSVAASAGSVAVGPVNERGRMPLEGRSSQRKSRQRSWTA
ncbi:hypothetical protein [Bradyrhizobium sp. STM 3561]|uniref:hypothetical protein n=1 Tax=Bradyrhizobium sp. STM 3561 TaxID=578923 RepID=UPI0038905A91